MTSVEADIKAHVKNQNFVSKTSAPASGVSASRSNAPQAHRPPSRVTAAWGEAGVSSRTTKKEKQKRVKKCECLEN